MDCYHLVSSGSSACPPGAWRSDRTSRDAPSNGLSAIGTGGIIPSMYWFYFWRQQIVALSEAQGPCDADQCVGPRLGKSLWLAAEDALGCSLFGGPRSRLGMATFPQAAAPSMGRQDAQERCWPWHGFSFARKGAYLCTPEAPRPVRKFIVEMIMIHVSWNTVPVDCPDVSMAHVQLFVGQ